MSALAPPLTGLARRRFAVAALGVAAALSLVDGPVLCPVRRCTGGYCPACGLTRSTGRLLRADVAASWHEHPFLLLALAQVAVVLGVGGAILATGRALGHRPRLRLGRPTDPLRWIRPILLVETVLLVAIWVIRLAQGTIPAPFLAG